MVRYLILSGIFFIVLALEVFTFNWQSQSDYSLRASALNDRVLVFGTEIKSTLESIRKSNEISPNASAALGRTLSIAIMMASMQKPGGSTNINIICDGPIGGITVNANSEGRVKGYVKNPNVDLFLNNRGKLKISPVIGNGTIKVTMIQTNGETIKKESPIVSGEIGEDFSYFFSEIQGMPTAVAVGEIIDTDNSIRVSGGFIIQIVEPLNDEEIYELENRLNQMESLSSQLSNGKTVQEILESIVGPIKIIERKQINNF